LLQLFKPGFGASLQILKIEIGTEEIWMQRDGEGERGKEGDGKDKRRDQIRNREIKTIS